MIKHLLFYGVETTLITGLAWLGLFLAANGLKRMGFLLAPRWTLTISALWLVIACLNVVMSEVIGPEFTLHYYFGIWTLIGGSALWTVGLTRQAVISIKVRLAWRTQTHGDVAPKMNQSARESQAPEHSLPAHAQSEVDLGVVNLLQGLHR